MHYYWSKCKSCADYFISQKLKECETVKDPKKNYSTNRYDEYIVIGSGFDTETSRIQVSGYDTAYVYHWQFSLGNVEFLGRSLDEFEEFLDCLLKCIPTGKKILTFVANLGYDYYFCKGRFSKFGITRHFEKSTRNILLVEIQNKIVLRECIGLFGKSLAQIAKNFCKTQKSTGDLDYQLCRLSKTEMSDTEIQYCINDVKCLSELGDYTFKNYYKKGKSLPLTAISELRQDVKDKMGKKYFEFKEYAKECMPSEDEYYLFRNWLFKGGLCGTNSLYVGQHLKNIGHADFNSHYPACMNHFLYPMGSPVKCNPSEFLTKNIPYIAVVKFANLKSRSSHSLLSTHKAIGLTLKEMRDLENFTIDNGRIWKATEITYVVNDVEFATICEMYDFDINETEILHCWKFEKYARLPFYLLDVLNAEYLKKTVLKNQDLTETLDYEFAKNKVNGNFGMTCTALYMDKFVIDDTGEIMPDKDENGKRNKRLYSDALKSVFLSPFWGMWITSYARSLLVKFISRFPNAIIQYDTDSIFFRTDTAESKRLIKYIEKYNEQTKQLNSEIFKEKEFLDLGCFAVDKELMTDFKGLGAKRYIYRQFYKKKKKYIIESVVAGCRKGTILKQFEFNTGKNPYDNVDELFEFFRDGLKVDKEHSGKLSSTYVESYDGFNSTYVVASDYNKNEEVIKLESAVLLKPVEFNLGLSDIHVRFYMMIQNAYNNAPDKYSNLFRDFIGEYELLDNTDVE